MAPGGGGTKAAQGCDWTANPSVSLLFLFLCFYFSGSVVGDSKVGLTGGKFQSGATQMIYHLLGEDPPGSCAKVDEIFIDLFFCPFNKTNCLIQTVTSAAANF